MDVVTSISVVRCEVLPNTGFSQFWRLESPTSNSVNGFTFSMVVPRSLLPGNDTDRFAKFMAIEFDSETLQWTENSKECDYHLSIHNPANPSQTAGWLSLFP